MELRRVWARELRPDAHLARGGGRRDRGLLRKQLALLRRPAIRLDRDPRCPAAVAPARPGHRAAQPLLPRLPQPRRDPGRPRRRRAERDRRGPALRAGGYAGRPAEHNLREAALVTVELRPPVREDAAAIAEALNEFNRPAGFDLDSAEEVAVWLEFPSVDLAKDVRVAVDGGRIVGYAEAVQLAGDAKLVFGDVRAGPEHGDASAALLGFVEARARELASPGGRLRIWTAERAEAARQLLEKRGFEVQRYSLRMVADLEAEPAEPHWPEGISVRTRDGDGDDRAAYELQCETFADQGRDYISESFEDWLHWVRREPFDPELWFLAFSGDGRGVARAWARLCCSIRSGSCAPAGASGSGSACAPTTRRARCASTSAWACAKRAARSGTRRRASECLGSAHAAPTAAPSLRSRSAQATSAMRAVASSRPGSSASRRLGARAGSRWPRLRACRSRIRRPRWSRRRRSASRTWRLPPSFPSARSFSAAVAARTSARSRGLRRATASSRSSGSTRTAT